MPKKKVKFKFPKVNPRIVGAVLGAVVITSAAGGLIYAKTQGVAAALRLGGIRAGIWFDPNTGEPQVETGRFGCCRPMCSNSFELECQQLSEGIETASFDNRLCDHVEECQEGCCQIDCKVRNLPHEACTYMGGDWSETCEIGCCKTEYSENEIPEKTCLCDSTGSWYPGVCAKGFYVYLKGGEAGSVDFTDDWGDKGMGSGLNSLMDMMGADRSQSIDYEYDLYTCGETPYGDWYGTKKTITYSGVDGETTTKEDDEYHINIPEGGLEVGGDLFPGTANISGSYKIEGNTMIMDMKMPLVPDTHLSGTIYMGAEECKNWKKLDRDSI
jgi:hypothetical protein